MAQSGGKWSAGLEWHRAELTGALDWKGTEISRLERSIGKAQNGVDWSAGLEWHRAELTGALDLNGIEQG